MTRTALANALHRAAHRLPDGPTALRLGATGIAGVIAVWSLGLALALLAAVLVGAVALAAAVAVIALGTGLVARRRPALVKAAVRDTLRPRAAVRRP